MFGCVSRFENGSSRAVHFTSGNLDLKERGLFIEAERWRQFESSEFLPSVQTLLELCSILQLPAELLTTVREVEHKKSNAFQLFQSRAQGRIRQAKEEEETTLFRFLPRLIEERSVIDEHVLWSSIPIYCSGYKTSFRKRLASLFLVCSVAGWKGLYIIKLDTGS